ncbi:b5fc90c4-77a7-4a6f-9a96-77317750b6f1 [Sclerotinia trifoliorum]|uniref:B5fc90c4-77a7-4a6f-9a96-77317750b6f1 n=1 Tax=Sclerotinia trifoliorum TaxID=28548 RepID=A0A8H2W2V9_9HELO|nr:b5fc90c4-77a7-4a6f-9a96-77317750b6f1 [Sclerotinia trifoliorum]
MAGLRREAPSFQVEERNVGEKCERAAAAKNLPTNSVDLGSEIWKVAKSNVIGVSIEGYYFPDDEYDRLLKEDTIQDALGGGYEVLPLVKYVLDHAKKTFATLLQVFTDSKSRREVMDSLMASEFKDTLLGSHKLDPSYFKHKLWNESTIDTFKDKRLPFIVPTFNSETFIYEFDKNQPLPFTVFDKADTSPRSGHFSVVECVEMLASKQNMVDVKSKTLKVALKKLIKLGDPGYDIKKEWEREARAHQQLNRKSDNIIQAFAAYHQIAMNNKRNDEYYLVLEWADGGSLFDFWQKNPEPQMNHPDPSQVRRRIKEMLEQLYGLAQALEAMHSTRAHSPRHSRSNSASSPALRPQMGADWKESSLGAGVLPVDSSSLPTFNFDPAEDDDNKQTMPSIVVSSDPVTLKVTESPDSQNWRHGDIKPENILRFVVGEDYDKLGVLKLADLGRAQQHQFVTRMRHSTERELWRTRWYEPPDLDGKNQEKAGGKISRLFDIWSMGAVIFEAMLWLLYGYESHNEFLRQNGFPTGETRVTPYWRKDGEGHYRVTEVANQWMEDILKRDLEREGAIGDVIKLVRDRLLKIDLPPNSDTYTKSFRTNARDLREQLGIIIKRAEGDERYLFSGKDRRSMSPPHVANSTTKSSLQSLGSSLLSANDAKGVSTPVIQGWRTEIAQRREYTNSMKDEWGTFPENSSFVESMLEGWNYSLSEPKLCTGCSTINIPSQHSEIAYHMGTLEAKSRNRECDLCRLVYTAAKERNLTSHGDIQEILLKQSGKDFILKETSQKFLRLIETKQGTLTPEAAPMLPLLPINYDPSPGNLGFFIKLAKAWLKDCDSNHGDVCAAKATHLLPKRLISVETLQTPKIVVTADLYKNLPPGGVRYLALSHKWGNMPADAKTMKVNLEQRKKEIPLDELPLSFQNAIAITKALDCSFLWIDSLCILQGPDGEFGQEADKMQTTFNGAYCVLAACSAQSARDGFLYVRESRSKYLEINNVYISPITNDFERDVLHSSLSRRGWVLQERALARRTIFFTETQIYWECGKGIRCETLATLRNDKIAFLGDPNFPDYTIRPTSTVGEQIDLFIHLFQTYTKLEFSYPEDRPVAIDGLMERLTVAFKTRSLAGLFETFWGRCLLWRRAENVELLRKIPHGTHSRRVPPTWSWMAFDGAISFIEPLGGQVDWNNSGVTLPFANLNCDQTSWLKTSRQNDSLAIQAKAFDFNIHAGAGKSEASIFYDGEMITPTKCVIVGTDKQNSNDASTKKHYVLIVKPVSEASNRMSYERVGAGYMSGKFIHLDESYVTVKIE